MTISISKQIMIALSWGLVAVGFALLPASLRRLRDEERESPSRF